MVKDIWMWLQETGNKFREDLGEISLSQTTIHKNYRNEDPGFPL